MKYIIDTDIGDDIDDALALGYALEKGIDVIGVTTVYRESEKRLDIVKEILCIAGREDIPVYAGYDNPIDPVTPIIGKLHYKAKNKEKITYCPEKAIEFIADCAEKYGQELVILAIGEQTNIAKAWRAYPEKMKKAGRLVIMGGCFTLHHNEWNIAGDPLAAKIVAESGMPILYVPWNITKDVDIGQKNYDYILNYSGGLLQEYISNLVRQWRERVSYIPVLHDPLALICATNESYYKSKRIKMAVMTEGLVSGFTINIDDLDSNISKNVKGNEVDVITEVDGEAIVNEFMDTFFSAKSVL